MGVKGSHLTIPGHCLYSIPISQRGTKGGQQRRQDGQQNNGDNNDGSNSIIGSRGGRIPRTEIIQQACFSSQISSQVIFVPQVNHQGNSLFTDKEGRRWVGDRTFHFLNLTAYFKPRLPTEVPDLFFSRNKSDPPQSLAPEKYLFVRSIIFLGGGSIFTPFVPSSLLHHFAQDPYLGTSLPREAGMFTSSKSLRTLLTGQNQAPKALTPSRPKKNEYRHRPLRV